MSHNCRAMLCDSPHEEAGHFEECGCAECHEVREHDWRTWAIYPECDGCLLDLSVWLAENTDYFELQREYGRAA